LTRSLREEGQPALYWTQWEQERMSSAIQRSKEPTHVEERGKWGSRPPEGKTSREEHMRSCKTLTRGVFLSKVTKRKETEGTTSKNGTGKKNHSHKRWGEKLLISQSRVPGRKLSNPSKVGVTRRRKPQCEANTEAGTGPTLGGRGHVHNTSSLMSRPDPSAGLQPEERTREGPRRLLNDAMKKSYGDDHTGKGVPLNKTRLSGRRGSSLEQSRSQRNKERVGKETHFAPKELRNNYGV